MTRYGVVTIAQDWPNSGAHPDALIVAREQWTFIAGAEPDAYPILHRLGGTDVSRTVAALIKTGGPLYLTPQDDPDAILAGKYDDELRRLRAAIGPDTLVRILHEPDADKWSTAHWASRWSPEVWARVFVHIAPLVGGRSWLCLIWHGKDNWIRWKPYLDALAKLDFRPDVVGFDIYVDDNRRSNGRIVRLERRIQPWVERLRKETGRPVSLGEVGSAEDEDQVRVLRRLSRVRGVELIVVMDWDRNRLTNRSRSWLGRQMR